MASSDSMKQAQAIKLCELCQEDTIKWRCVDCNMCLCEKCKTFHLRVPATTHHLIVTIGTLLDDVQKKIFIDNIPCKDHQKKMTCLFCKSCDSLICPDCVSSSHKTHNFVPIDSALDEKLAYLKGMNDKIEADLKSCESKVSEIYNIKPKFKIIFDKSLTKIKEKEQELIKGIKRYSSDLQQKVKSERSKVNKTLMNVKEKVDSTMKELNDQKRQIEKVLSSNQGAIIFEAAMTVNDIKFDSIPNEVERFNPGIDSMKKTQETFGSLLNISMADVEPLSEIDFVVTRTVMSDLSYIGNVITIDDTSAWINCYEQGIIRKISIVDNQMIVSKQFNVQAYSITATPNNELLLSMASGPYINLLKKSGEIVSCLTVLPLIPYGIHVTKDNYVIVGVSEPADPYTITESSVRAIMVFSMFEKKKILYSYKKDKKKLISYPSRITTNINQDILVVNSTSKYTGQLVALNREGTFRWIYKGNSSINETYKFDPRVAAATGTGNIVISDFNSMAIHVLSEDGEILASKFTKDLGVVWPWGLDTISDGTIWLGCGESRDFNDKKTPALFHTIQIKS